MKLSILATTALLATICLATPALSTSRQEKTQDFAMQLQIPSSSPNSKPGQVTNTVGSSVDTMLICNEPG